MPVKHDIIAVGASAGGVGALTRLCRGLPADLPAALLVVQHVARTAHSVLPQLLSKAGPMPALHPQDGEPIRPGRIYVAPPDRHLLVSQSGASLILRCGPQENRTRPAIDPLFRSAALAFGPRVVGVVLTGLLDDGTAGLVAIKGCGGLTVVQEPGDAEWPEMPRNALRGDSPDFCLPMDQLPALLVRLAGEPAGPSRTAPRNLAMEVAIAEQEIPGMTEEKAVGHPSPMSCPQCGGVLNEIHEGKSVRYRCQIGHAYAPESLAAAQSDALEEALAAAARTHHDRCILFRRMERNSRLRGLDYAAARWATAAAEAERAASMIIAAIKHLRESSKHASVSPAEEDPKPASAEPA